jgi:hypothetical protein
MESNGKKLKTKAKMACEGASVVVENQFLASEKMVQMNVPLDTPSETWKEVGLFI